MVIGREDVLHDLKVRLGITTKGQTSTPVQILIGIRGWPGVGKTTLAAVLAHDPDIAAAFPNCILWLSVGPTPDLFSKLAEWGRALGTDDLLKAKTLEEASAQLRGLLLQTKLSIALACDVLKAKWNDQKAIAICIQGIVDSLNKALGKPHEIRLFEVRQMFLVQTLKETFVHDALNTDR